MALLISVVLLALSVYASPIKDLASAVSIDSNGERLAPRAELHASGRPSLGLEERAQANERSLDDSQTSPNLASRDVVGMPVEHTANAWELGDYLSKRKNVDPPPPADAPSPPPAPPSPPPAPVTLSSTGLEAFLAARPASSTFLELDVDACADLVMNYYRNTMGMEESSNITWNALVTDLKGASEDSIRGSLSRYLVEEGGGYYNGIKKIFDSSALATPQAVPPDKAQTYNLFDHTAGQMYMLLYAYGVHESWSYSFRAVNPVARPKAPPSPKSLAIAMFVYIGELLTNMMELVGHDPTPLTWDKAALCWAVCATLRNLYDTAMKTISTIHVRIPITITPQDDVEAAIAVLQSGTMGAIPPTENLAETLEVPVDGPNAYNFQPYNAIKARMGKAGKTSPAGQCNS